LKRITYCLMFTLLATSAGLLAQTSTSNFASSSSSAQATAPPLSKAPTDSSPAPFSRLALSGGIGANGINFQVAVEANRYINIRGVGNYFSYTLNNVKSNGVSATGTLSMATGGVSVDLYPFPNHGWRLSPGALFYNQNGASLTGTITGGNSFTMNSDKYYSDPESPVTMAAGVVLNKTNPAFTMTTGWGNLISRKGGHFSVPFEIGAAFVGSPTVNINYTGGEVCNEALTSCQTAATDTALATDTAAQVAKYNSDLNVLKVYPIFSIGIGYNFNIR